LDRRLGGPQNQSGCSREKKNSQLPQLSFYVITNPILTIFKTSYNIRKKQNSSVLEECKGTVLYHRTPVLKQNLTNDAARRKNMSGPHSVLNNILIMDVPKYIRSIKYWTNTCPIFDIFRICRKNFPRIGTKSQDHCQKPPIKTLTTIPFAYILLVSLKRISYEHKHIT
jgi:hypothetical protein